jgi:lipid-A-disaccharide synthase
MARAAVAESGLAIDVFVGRTPELIELADCCLAVSGSVSLELLHHARPTAILYWISPLAYAVQKRFRRVKYITLVNLLAAGELFPADTTPYDPDSPQALEALFPEYLTCQDKSPQLARHVVEWLSDRQQRGRLVERLERLRDEVGQGGAAARAADYLLTELGRRAAALATPHFRPNARTTGAAAAATRKSAA